MELDDGLEVARHFFNEFFEGHPFALIASKGQLQHTAFNRALDNYPLKIHEPMQVLGCSAAV